MRPWTSWTAKAAVLTLTAGLAVTVGGLSGVALAASGSSSAALAASGAAASPAGMPGDVCSDAGALLGLTAACQSIALPGLPGAGTAQTARSAGSQGAGRESVPARHGTATSQGAGQGVDATVSPVVQRAVAPVTAVLGASGTVPVLTPVPTLAPLTAVTGAAPAGRTGGAGGASARGTDSTTGKNTPAARAGDTNVPAATQLAGLGALPGLADLPSSAGLASTPARNGAMGGGNPMPGTALSAANSGMSSDSFAALAVGALLAGASALKIAGRRARDRKAGLE
jgi:hypothetical protein